MRDKIGWIYLIHNTTTNAMYIGQTLRSPEKRFAGHLWALERRSHNNKHLQSAFLKYGKAAFELETLESCSNLSETNEAEAFFINYLRFIGAKLYNQRPGGLQSLESIEANSRAHMGIKRKMETRLAISKTLTGVPHTEERKRASSLGHRGQKVSSEHRQKLRIAFTGRKRSESTRAAMSRGLTGKKLSDAHRAAISSAHLGLKRPEEVRRKISAYQKGRPKSEAHRIAAAIGRWGHVPKSK